MAILRLARRIPPLPGGQEQHVARLASEMTILGRLNVVAYSEGSPSPDAPFAHLRVMNVRKLPSDYARGVLFAASVLAALRFGRRIPPIRVVHSHGTAGDLWATIRLKSQRVLAFHTFHASLVFPAHVRATYRRILPKLDGIFVVSDLIRDQLSDLGCPLPPVYTLTSAVDPEFFSVTQELNASRALMVGRLVPFKGFDTGLRTAAKLFRMGLISGVDIVGSGPLHRELRELAATERLPALFHGQVDKPRLTQIMRQTCMLLCPSRELPGQAEGSPTVILEAWSAGIPVLASRSGGIARLVRDGEDGLLAPEGDADLFVARAQELLQRRPRLIAAGRERVAGYTWRTLADRVGSIYTSHGSRP